MADRKPTGLPLPLSPTTLATPHRFLPLRRVLVKPCRSNIETVPLCRKEADRPSASSG